MQSLGVCPLKSYSCVTPRKKRPKRRSPICSSHRRSSCILMGFHNSTRIRLGFCQEFDSGSGISIPRECSRLSKLAWAADIGSSDCCSGIDLSSVGKEIRVDGAGEEENRRIDVRDLAWSLRSAKLPEDVEEVLKGKGELPLQVFSSMIKGFGRDGCMDAAMAVVEWLKRKKDETPNVFIYNSLLGAVKLSKKFDYLDRVVEDMRQEGVAPNAVTYNTLMVIYIEQGRPDKALQVFDEMPGRGFDPTPVSYSTALMAYRRMEDGVGALRFFVEFREKFRSGELGRDGEEDWEAEFVKLENFTVRICYQVMRRWLVNDTNSSKDVLMLLCDMDTAGLGLSRTDLEKIVWACTREEHYVVGKELYVRIREKFGEISLSVCNHLIWLMGKARKWWAALEIYEDLLDIGPSPNNMSTELVISHFNVLLSAARKKGIWRWGVRLIDKMEEKGLKPGSKEWNSVLIACSRASEASAAIEIFKRMVEKGEKPTIISYGALLSALEKGRLYDEAMKVWDHMVKLGVDPNLYAYTTMASILTGRGDFGKLDSLIQEMDSLGIEPTVVTYNAIITGFAKIGSGSLAYEWFSKMKDRAVLPNEVTYEMLIEALCVDGKPRLAFDIYVWARNEGLSLSCKAYDSVSRSVTGFGASVDLRALGPRPPDTMKKEKVPEVSGRSYESEYANNGQRSSTRL